MKSGWLFYMTTSALSMFIILTRSPAISGILRVIRDYKMLYQSINLPLELILKGYFLSLRGYLIHPLFPGFYNKYNLRTPPSGVFSIFCSLFIYDYIYSKAIAFIRSIYIIDKVPNPNICYK